MSEIMPIPGMTVNIKVEGSSFPSNGNAGEVLTKTENGVEWKMPQKGSALAVDDEGNATI